VLFFATKFDSTEHGKGVRLERAQPIAVARAPASAPALSFFSLAIPVMGVLIIILASTLRASPRECWDDMVTAIAYIAFLGIGLQIQELLIRIFPNTVDFALLRADHIIGFDPVAFAHGVSQHKIIMAPIIIGYTLLPAVIGVAWVAEQDRRARRSAIIGGTLCWVFYAIFPAVGTHNYDWPTGVASQVLPRNCLPSMHLTWAILIAWNARSRSLRAVLWGYAVLTAIATIVVGDHYLVDLIAAVPYSAAVQWLSSLNFRRVPVIRRIQAIS
jgi:hypothetical protein